MGWWKCCCAECLIFGDDFTRDEPGTPMGYRDSAPFAGKGWCDNPGEYYIVNVPTWRARCEVPNAKAICNVKHPNEVGSMYVSIKTQDEEPRTASAYAEGQKWRVYLNVTRSVSGNPPVCTPISYYFAEYERLGGSIDPADRSWIRLGIGSGGAETILKELPVFSQAGLSRRLWAAIDEDSFCAGVTETILGSVTMKSPGLFENGWYSGFGMSEEDMLADDFEFYRHYNSDFPKTRDQGCPGCASCLCEDNTNYGTDDGLEIPPVLNVCIWTDPEGCPRLENLEPCSFEIEYDRVEGQWIHEGFKCCGSFRVEFGCGGGIGAERYPLTNMGACHDSALGPDSRYPNGYTCSSETGEICFTYGPYFVAELDFACQCRDTIFGTGSCEYYITVTAGEPCTRKDCRNV